MERKRKKITEMTIKFLVALVPVVTSIAVSLIKVSFDILKDTTNNLSKKL